MAVLSAIYVPALIMFVRAFRAARWKELDSTGEALQLAVMRLNAAIARHRTGDLRTAIVEAAAAADLAQVADPTIAVQVGRGDLDALRRMALDVDHQLTDDEAELALALARSLLTTVAATTS